jgi:alpha-glucosidase
VASRFDGDGRGPARARAVLLMLYALRGTPFVYQGEELGLPDAEIPPDRVVDVDGRDPERAPIPWAPPSQAGPGAGFTTGRPWLPLVANAERLAVAAQADDPDSTLSLARRLAALRRRLPSLQGGEQRSVTAGDDLLAWLRIDGGDSYLAIVNFAAERRRLSLPRDLPAHGTLAISTDPARSGGRLQLDGLPLAPSEAVIVHLQ